MFALVVSLISVVITASQPAPISLFNPCTSPSQRPIQCYHGEPGYDESKPAANFKPFPKTITFPNLPSPTRERKDLLQTGNPKGVWTTGNRLGNLGTNGLDLKDISLELMDLPTSRYVCFVQ